MEDERPTRGDLHAIAALLPALSRVEAQPAQWRKGPQDEGTLQIPFLYSPEAERVMAAVYEHRLFVEFDWVAWQEDAKRFLEPRVVAGATLVDLRRLLTLHVRKERFCDGHFAEMIKSGHIAAILRRLGELANTYVDSMAH
jgi:hypothetical protein